MLAGLPLQSQSVSDRHQMHEISPRTIPPRTRDWCNCYAVFLSNKPWAVVVCVLAVFTAIVVSALTTRRLPQFSDPADDFQVINSELSARLQQLKNLVQYSPRQESSGYNIAGRRERRGIEIGQAEHLLNISRSNKLKEKPGKKFKRPTRPNELQHTLEFCKFDTDTPFRKMSRYVYVTSYDSPLLTFVSFTQMCKIETSMQRYMFRALKQPTGRYCSIWSAANYITYFAGKANCLSVSRLQFVDVMENISRCNSYFNDEGVYTCWDTEMNLRPKCFSYPRLCKDVRLFEFYANILPSTTREHLKDVTSVLTILPLSTGRDSLPLYHFIVRNSWFYHSYIHIDGAYFDIDAIVFPEVLMKDAYWLILASVLVLLIIWSYTTSVLLTLAACILAFLSISVSLCLYYLIFNPNAFPSINLMAVVLTIGLGADNVFIFWSIFQSKKSNEEGSLPKLVTRVLSKAMVTIFVTNITTAVALYINFMSGIAALKSFAIFSGTVVMVNFILSATWVPACVIMIGKHCSTNTCDHVRTLQYIKRKFKAVAACANSIIFERLSFLAICLRFASITLLSMGWISLLVLVIINYYQSISGHYREPSLYTFRHPFERYTRIYRDQFTIEVQARSKEYLNVVFVWGVLPFDDRSWIKPTDSAKLVVNPKFKLSTPEAQVWFMNFCSQVLNSTLVVPNSQRSGSCFDQLRDNIYNSKECAARRLSPECCSSHYFPFRSNAIFNKCIVQYSELPQFDLGETFRFIDSKLVGVTFLITTNFSRHLSYRETRDAFDKVETWFAKQLSAAPPEMRNGFLASDDLVMFDLHSNLVDNLPRSCLVMMAVSVGMIFLVTSSPLITLYTAIAILAMVSCTLAAVSIIGWQFDIIVCVVILLAVGLSIDFVVHYGIAYLLCTNLAQRRERTEHALKRLVRPLTAAALTTFVAGISMLPSVTLVCFKIGVFLALMSLFGWLYATFYYAGILAVLGPSHSCDSVLQPFCISRCCVNCFRCLWVHHVDKTRYRDRSSNNSFRRSCHRCENEGLVGSIDYLRANNRASLHVFPDNIDNIDGDEPRCIRNGLSRVHQRNLLYCTLSHSSAYLNVVDNTAVLRNHADVDISRSTSHLSPSPLLLHSSRSPSQIIDCDNHCGSDHVSDQFVNGNVWVARGDE